MVHHVCLLVCLPFFVVVTLQVAILLTDGKQTDADLNKPVVASKALQALGVHVYSFGIGDDIDNKMLLDIASDEQDKVFLATNFNEMKGPAKKMLTAACDGRHLIHC